ncbi:MAG TPA: hypothetical protein VLB69_12445 [Rudaea sp.]|nr:hypothetical protein [Rudaea sp.]
MWKLLRNLLLVAVLLAGALKLVLWYEVRQSAARLVSAWAPYAQVQYDSIGIGLDGTIGVGGLGVTFGKGPGRSTWRATQVDIETSGPFWVLRRTLLADQSFPAHLGVSIRGLQPPAGASPFDWHWLSPLSLVPFETFGCGVVSRLSIADYQRMGLNPGVAKQHLEYRYDAAANSLTFAGELSTPPFSAITLTGELQRFDARALTLKSWPKLHIAVLTAEYADSGYLAKRNRFCAQQAGVNPAAFVDQHIDAIKSYLDSLGVQTTAGVESIYRDLVTSGGRMSVQSLPTPGFTLDTFSSATPDALVRQLNLTTRHNDAPPVMLRLTFKATYVAEDATAVAPTPPPAAAPATAPPANTSAAVGTPAPPPSVIPPAATVASTSPATSPTPPPASAPKPRVETPPPVVPAHAPTPPAPSVAATPPKTGGTPTPAPTTAASARPAKPAETATLLPSTPTPPEGSTLALVWKPTIDRLPDAPPPARDYDVIDAGAANNFTGRFVRVLTAGGKKVEGHIIRADATTLALRITQPGGSAELHVQRSVIVEIQLPHQRQPAAGG